MPAGGFRFGAGAPPARPGHRQPSIGMNSISSRAAASASATLVATCRPHGPPRSPAAASPRSPAWSAAAPARSTACRAVAPDHRPRPGRPPRQLAQTIPLCAPRFRRTEGAKCRRHAPSSSRRRRHRALQRRFEPRGQLVQLPPPHLCRLPQRGAQLQHRPVQPLARRLQQHLGPRQPARQVAQPLPPRGHALPRGPRHVTVLLPHPVQQVEPHRNRHLGRRRRRRRAPVGGVVDQRGVRLVPHGGDQRDDAFRRGAHHRLLVEAPEVLEAPAATRHDQDVGPRDRPALRQRVEAPDGARHLRRAGRALHRDGPDQHVARKPVAQAVQDIADHRARGRGHDADHLRQEGQRLLPPLVEQSLLGQRRAPPLQHRHQRAGPAGTRSSITSWYFDWPGKVVSRPSRPPPSPPPGRVPGAPRPLSR
jgi:hypothetical protein